MKRSAKILLVLGCALICCSVALLLFSGLRSGQAARDNAETVRAMESVLPESVGDTALFYGAEMPVLEIGGEDYCAMLEVPAFGLKLPVAAQWSRVDAAEHPCRFCGNIYDGSLVIGGSDLKGQFDFLDSINDGAEVLLTDMTGAVFSLRVERVERSDSAEGEKLAQSDARLTLFARDSRSMEYIILRCGMK